MGENSPSMSLGLCIIWYQMSISPTSASVPMKAQADTTGPVNQKFLSNTFQEINRIESVGNQNSNNIQKFFEIFISSFNVSTLYTHLIFIIIFHNY